MKIEDLYTLFLECSSVSTDTRKIEKDNLFFALKGDTFNGNAYAEKAINNGAKFAIIDEANFVTSKKTILVANVLETLQELSTYHRAFLNKPIVALTGSNGKTTTKELIKAVLSKKYNITATKGNLNNHIGVPLSLLSMTSDTELGIIEMGANHQKEIDFLCRIAKPDFGYITNFGKAHLEGFGGVEGVIRGKCEMYDYLKANNKLVFINANDSIQLENTKNTNSYSFGNEIYNSDVLINFIKATPFVTCQYNNLDIQSQLIGDYNFNNIAAAIAIGKYFKVEDLLIKNAIQNYIPSNNRSQIIEKGSNKIILDAYNANPTSMNAALLNFEKQQSNYKIAILGDMFELGKEAVYEHQNITDLALSLDINKVIFIGENFCESNINSKNAIQFKSFESFKENKTVIFENASILIKGSRGMALERIIEIL